MNQGQNIGAPTELSSKAKRLGQLGSWIAWITAICTFTFISWTCSSPARLLGQAKQLVETSTLTIALDNRAWLLGSIVIAVGAALFIWLMICCARLFSAISEGDLFGQRAEDNLLRLSRIVLASAIFGVVQRTLLALVLTMGNGEGKKPFILTVSTEDVIAIILAILLVIFAQIVREARRAREENAQFI